jgi:hypothetical protein
MTVAWPYAVAASVAALASLLSPLTSAILPEDAWPLRLAAAAIAAFICFAVAISRGVRPAVWTTIAIVATLSGIAVLLLHIDTRTECLADYDGRVVVIGRQYLPEMAVYVANSVGLSAADRLLDAGGVPGRIWTAESIRTCTRLVGIAGLAAIPCVTLAATALVARHRHRFLPSPMPPARTAPSNPHASAAVQTHRYDAFLSYRHSEPDRAYALEVLEYLENRRLRVAIDIRDFKANEHFLSEMERCIKESRFVLCVVTATYLASDHTSEEAIIAKTLDMSERRKRLIPLIFQRTELPVWLHGLVGIDFTQSATVDPFERLCDLLQASRHTDNSPYEHRGR